MTHATTFPPIWTAICQLLQLKESVTYAEVAIAAGVKKPKCLEVIARNKHLLVVDKKGLIHRFVTDDELIIKKANPAFADNKLFIKYPVNYGTDYALRVYDDVGIKDLYKPYCVGGIGDNYMTEFILATPENCAELVKRGFVFWDDYIKQLRDDGVKVLREWQEP